MASVRSSERIRHSDATTATTIDTRMTTSECQVSMCGTHVIGSPPLIQLTSLASMACRTSLTPMNPRIAAMP